MSKTEVNYRISKFAGYFLMTGTAFAFDLLGLLGFIPGVGNILVWIISIVNWALFYLWFKTKGVSYMKNPKIMKTLLIGIVLSVIPFINALPIEYTLTVARIVFITRLEDKNNFKAPSAKPV